MDIKERLKKFGIELPQSTPPSAVYCPGVMVNGLIFTAGQTSKLNGVLQYKGKIGAELTLEEGQQAARMCAVNCLAIADRLCGLNNIERIVKLTGFVNCIESFCGQSQVIDGASKVLTELWGDKGYHARSAVGVSSLPGNACCEIEMIFQVK